MTTEDIFDLMNRRGTGRYGLSAVSQVEHALQSAALATQRNLGDEMVIGALFHTLIRAVQKRVLFWSPENVRTLVGS